MIMSKCLMMMKDPKLQLLELVLMWPDCIGIGLSFDGLQKSKIKGKNSEKITGNMPGSLKCD